MNDDTSLRAIELIDGSKDGLTDAVSRQILKFVPRYKGADLLETNVRAILDGIAIMVRGESREELVKTVEVITSNRSATGFSVGDYALASMCFLPVLRKFFLECDPERGLEMYDIVESVSFPFMAQCISIFVEGPPKAAQDGEALTLWDLVMTRVSDRRKGGVVPMSIERVR